MILILVKYTLEVDLFCLLKWTVALVNLLFVFVLYAEKNTCIIAVIYGDEYTLLISKWIIGIRIFILLAFVMNVQNSGMCI